MQRDIKFRAWREKRKLMSPVLSFFDWVDLGSACVEFVDKGDVRLMQFTGSKDSNGVEVYESDIMKGKSKVFGIVVGAVVFTEYIDGEEYIHEKHLGWNVNGIPLIDLINDGCVVDGNIYENPELINS